MSELSCSSVLIVDIVVRKGERKRESVHLLAVFHFRCHALCVGARQKLDGDASAVSLPLLASSKLVKSEKRSSLKQKRCERKGYREEFSLYATCFLRPVNEVSLFVGPQTWVSGFLVWPEVAPNTSQQVGVQVVEVDSCRDTSSGFQAAWASEELRPAVVAAVEGEAYGTGSLLGHDVPLCPVSRGVSASWPFSFPARESRVCWRLAMVDSGAFI